jgi:pimeloyl-ACP methyl ester carboxylesterase
MIASEVSKVIPTSNRIGGPGLSKRGNLFVVILVGCVISALGCAKKRPSLATGMRYETGSEFTATDGTVLNTEVAGTGNRDVVLIHGFAASIRNWDSIRPHLPDGSRYHFLDLKGFGFSSKPSPGDYSMEAQARLVREYIRSNRLERVTVIGHSYGGAVALTLLAKAQGDLPVDSLILIDSAGYPQRLPLFVRVLRDPFLRTIAKILPLRYRARQSVERSFADSSRVTDEIIDRYAFFYAIAGARKSYVQAAQQMIPEDMESIVSRYPQIEIPVRLIWGDKDPLIPVSIAHRFEEDLPRAQLSVVEDCGHVPQEEKPSVTADVVREFLMSLDQE